MQEHLLNMEEEQTTNHRKQSTETTASEVACLQPKNTGFVESDVEEECWYSFESQQEKSFGEPASDSLFDEQPGAWNEMQSEDGTQQLFSLTLDEPVTQPLFAQISQQPIIEPLLPQFDFIVGPTPPQESSVLEQPQNFLDVDEQIEPPNPQPLPGPQFFGLSLRVELLDNNGGIIYIISNDPFSEDYLASVTDLLSLILGREKKREGLTDQQIESLPRKEFDCIDQHNKYDCCTICMNEFTQGQKIIELSCEHVFGDQCIAPWLKNSSKCPNCRANVQPVNP